MLATRSSPAALAFGHSVAITDNVQVRSGIRILRGRDIESLVNVDDLKAHLLLLAVFHKTHHIIQQGGVTVDKTTRLPITTPIQFLSLARAQHRFDLWVCHVLRRSGRDKAAPWQLNEIPPIDVLMLLHAYMLSPWNFYEDCYRSYPELEALGPFPLILIVCSPKLLQM